MSFNRNFGIELEFKGLSFEQSATALRAAGIRVNIEGYNHNDHHDDAWKLVPDSSVRDGHELVSPVLCGHDGLKTAIRAAIAIERAGARVDISCGFHVHFDAHDLTANDVRTICKRYMKHEAIIDAMMPASRRGNSNQYCRSLTTCFADNREFEEAEYINMLARAQGHRYFKVNLQAFGRHGTIEFRQHSGTVDSSKIAYWVLFLNAFIEESVRISRKGGSVSASSSSALRGREKELVEFLTGGAKSADEIAASFGVSYRSVASIVRDARKHGVAIRTGRLNAKTFYSVMADAHAEDNDSLFDGVDDGIRAFYEIRSMNFAA